MKNRFIRMLSILCTIMLMTGFVSVWAWAEETAATPTDLAPSQEEEAAVPEEEETVVPEEKAEEEIETPEDKPQVPETEEDEKEENLQVPETEEDGKEEEIKEPEPPVDSVEVIITKSVRLGETWEGVTRDTKLTVLKLDLDKAQTIHLIVEGKNAWANIRKSEQSADNLRKVESNPETKRAVINLDAEAGSYLITIGPVEPNKMAKAKATILDDQGYAAWEASLENIEEEETAEEPAAEPENENAEEKPDETENETAEDLTEEPAKVLKEEQGEEQREEPAEESAGEPDEEFAGETEEEPGEAPEEELTEEKTGEPEEETTEETTEDTPEEPAEAQEDENEPAEEEPETGRSVDVEIKWDVEYPIVGDTAHFTATLNGYEDVDYSVQWQYSPDKETWYDIPGETETTMDMVITDENNVVYWRIIVYVEENQEE